MQERLRALMARRTAPLSGRSDQFASDWWTRTDFGYLLSTTIGEAAGLKWAFLKDTELKRLVIADYQEATRSFLSKNYKATVVLCGSIVEAVLTEVIAKAGIAGVTRQKLYNSDLNELIKLAVDYGFIKDSALQNFLAPLRKYRNLIHPGRALREEIHPDGSMAQIAIEGVKLLVGELNKRK